MKKSTAIELIEEMKRTKYSRNARNIIESLFSVYSTYEIKSVEDFLDAPDDFCGFVADNLDRIQCSSHNDIFDLNFALSNFYFEILYKLSDDYFSSQQNYVNMVREVVPNFHETRLLDAAAGNIPASSINLAQTISSVSTMDELLLSPEALLNFNVKGFDELMTLDTNMDGFDLVVSHHPCEATYTIIKNCARSSLPYLIHFCTCGLRYEGMENKSLKDIRKKIHEFDPRIKFYEQEAIDEGEKKTLLFGYALDIPQKEVEKVIRSNLTLPKPKFIKKIRDMFLESVISKRNQRGSD